MVQQKTRDIQKSYFSNYLKKAEECLHAARLALDNQEYNAASINAIHSCISGCDAMCVFYLGKRSASENHNDTVSLFKSIDATDEINMNANRIARVLGIKNMAEYEERLVFKSEAHNIFKDAERFIAYIKKTLPQ